MPHASPDEALQELKRHLRQASVATVGGFRPPDNPVTSWFLRGVGRQDEGLPSWQGNPMFPLLQIRVDELPVIPPQLRDTALLVVFQNMSAIPFDAPHGEGWLIREYSSLADLVPLPRIETPYKPFPIQWRKVLDDAPDWCDGWEVMDLTAINGDEAATQRFFAEFNRYDGTKVGGYPTEIQHEVGVADFVFQIDSEPKAGWMWADRGVGYFHRATGGEWRFSCQFL